MFANAKRRSRARHVLAVGEIAAVSSLVPLMDRFPAMTDLLKGREVATWDFFGTVADASTVSRLIAGRPRPWSVCCPPVPPQKWSSPIALRVGRRHERALLRVPSMRYVCGMTTRMEGLGAASRHRTRAA